MAMKTLIARRTDPDLASAQRVEDYGRGGVIETKPTSIALGDKGV